MASNDEYQQQKSWLDYFDFIQSTIKEIKDDTLHYDKTGFPSSSDGGECSNNKEQSK